MSENKTRRERAVNFTNEEVRILMGLICANKHILENKKTDAITNRGKETAWNKITESFNASSGSTTRTSKNLKLKYESVKKDAKKKSASNRQELYRTGGGDSSQTPYTDAEKSVLAICSNIGGLEPRNDSDTLPGSTNTHAEPKLAENTEFNMHISEAENLFIPVEVVDISTDEVIPGLQKKSAQDIAEAEESKVIDWRNWNPKTLKSRKSKVLNVLKENLHTKFSSIASTRIELVNLQIEIAKAELKFKEKCYEQQLLEHQARMQIMQIEIEIAKSKLVKEKNN